MINKADNLHLWIDFSSFFECFYASFHKDSGFYWSLSWRTNCAYTDEYSTPGDQSKCLKRQGAALMYTMLAYRVNRYQRVFSKEKVKLNFTQSFRTNDRLVSNSNKRNFCLLQKAFDDCLQTIASGEFQKVMRFCLFRFRIYILKTNVKGPRHMTELKCFGETLLLVWYRFGDLVAR